MTTSTEVIKTESTPKDYSDDPTINVDPTPSNEPELDNFGYKVDKTPAADPNKKEEPAADPNKKEEPAADPLPGYGQDDPEPAADPDKKEEDPAADPDKKDDPVEFITAEEAGKLLGDIDNRDVISKFAVDNKMTKEQVENYVELLKAEDAKFAEEQEKLTIETRKQWKAELKADKEFGGENFDKNLNRVSQVYDKYFPNLKKSLTDVGAMLPPYLMKDLLKLSKTMNETAKLVGGETPTPPKEEENFLDSLYN